MKCAAMIKLSQKQEQEPETAKPVMRLALVNLFSCTDYGLL